MLRILETLGLGDVRGFDLNGCRGWGTLGSPEILQP